MTESTVSIDAGTARAIVDELRRTDALSSVRVMLEAALSDAAEGAAWEPFRDLLSVVDVADHGLSPAQVSHLDQFSAQIRFLFAGYGLSIDDRGVLRTAMATAYIAAYYAAGLVNEDRLPVDPAEAIAAVITPVQIALARHVPEGFHP